MLFDLNFTPLLTVIAGLVPATHATSFGTEYVAPWVAGINPAMTIKRNISKEII